MSRLISIIIVLALFLTFIVLNIDNKSNISFGVKTFEEIPVYISVLFAFVMGMVFALPFTLSLIMRRRKSSQEEHHDSDHTADRKKLWGKDNNKDAGAPADSAEVNKDSGAYGID